VLKRCPKVLLDILKEVGAEIDESVYIGDSLMKDIEMAKEAGVLDVYAKYVAAQQRTEYELLRRVTHWPSKAVSDEKALSESVVQPTYTLHEKFSEVLGVAQRTLWSFRCSNGLALKKLL
jgi:phosphoglycolate phosphatase